MSVDCGIAYLADDVDEAVHHIFPRASGRPTLRPANVERMMPVVDGRSRRNAFTLDREGFELLEAPTAFTAFDDTDAIRARYYPETAELVRQHLNAFRVIPFDHNIRSRPRAEAGAMNVREPVKFAHNDYTARSGPVRAERILANAPDAGALLERRYAFVNAWRPLMGPVRDKPLALCDASSTAPTDLVTTEIRHYSDTDLEQPSHIGAIYSLRHNPTHRWFYFADMQPDEVVLLKCFDTEEDGRARFMPHTAIDLPRAATPSATTIAPRESIEVRTLVFF